MSDSRELLLSLAAFVSDRRRLQQADGVKLAAVACFGFVLLKLHRRIADPRAHVVALRGHTVRAIQF